MLSVLILTRTAFVDPHTGQEVVLERDEQAIRFITAADDDPGSFYMIEVNRAVGELMAKTILA